MNLETVFSLTSVLAMGGWLVLLFSPLLPRWAFTVPGLVIPLLLSGVYAALLAFSIGGEGGGGYGSLAEVMNLFSRPESVLAGWIHYLAFDLLVGAWICTTARKEHISFYLVLPCLPLAFLFGPVGFIAFSLVRLWQRRTSSATAI